MHELVVCRFHSHQRPNLLQIGHMIVFGYAGVYQPTGELQPLPNSEIICRIQDKFVGTNTDYEGNFQIYDGAESSDGEESRNQGTCFLHHSTTPASNKQIREQEYTACYTLF